MHNRLSKKNQSGFTFIEVLVAMLIFVMAVVTAIQLVKGAVQATRRAKKMTVASWLLQNVMSELETKIETVGLEEGCEEKIEAKFEEPFEEYQWVAKCYEIDYRMSETSAKIIEQIEAATGGEDAQVEGNSYSQNGIIKIILNIANDYIAKTLRELHAEVTWVEGKNERSVSATTHIVDLNKKLPPVSF